MAPGRRRQEGQWVAKMAVIKVGINGLGRMGQGIARVIALEPELNLEIAAINDLVAVEELASALLLDSVYGRFPHDVSVTNDAQLRIGDHAINVHAYRDAAEVPWGDEGVEVVLECTGHYRSMETAGRHLQAGAGRVAISAPAKDDTATVVLGINHDTLTADDRVVSNASCTTNCLAPMVKAIDASFAVKGGLMTTTHATTASQSPVDAFGGAKQRGLLNNIIPTTTGAASAVGRVLPHLAGKLNGTALRVPVDTGSVVKAVLLIDGQPGRERIAAAIADNVASMNASTPLGRIAYFGSYYQCSRDCVGEPYSAMITDELQTVEVDDGTLIKLSAFYDNELGYAYRMAELALVLKELDR